MMISTIDEMAKLFGKTRNACLYQIKLGRLSDPRSNPIESEGAEWPAGNKRGRKPGPSPARQRLAILVDSQAELIEALEKRVAFLETLSHTHD